MNFFLTVLWALKSPSYNLSEASDCCHAVSTAPLRGRSDGTCLQKKYFRMRRNITDSEYFRTTIFSSVNSSESFQLKKSGRTYFGWFSLKCSGGCGMRCDTLCTQGWFPSSFWLVSMHCLNNEVSVTTAHTHTQNEFFNGIRRVEPGGRPRFLAWPACELPAA